MEDVRKQDPTFTNFVPATAAEAVDRYVRCRKNGLKPMLVPECLIACARGLPAAELDKFENWIISPNVDLENVDLVPFDTVRLENDKTYRSNLMRLTGRTCNLGPRAKLSPKCPPLPADDEKVMPEPVRDSLDLSPEAPRMRLAT